MADRYVYHGGSNTSPYNSWATAATTINSAIGGAAAGDNFWIASDHVESTASALSLSIPGSAATPSRVISVNRAGSVPPVPADLLPGASLSTTGANGITISGTSGAHLYFYGITFNCGTGASTATLITASTTSSYQKYEACSFNITNTAAASRLTIGSGANAFVEFANCTASFTSTSQGIFLSGFLRWTNGPGSPTITGTPPTVLFKGTTNRVRADLSGLDLSVFGSGYTLVDVTSARILIENCKLGASVTVAATPTAGVAMGTRVIGSHSSGNVRRDEIYTYQGTLTTETTIIRTAGASDGTTPFSWMVVTTANSERDFPFETFDGAVWNAATGSAKTLTIHTVTDNVTLTDAEIWVEVEYLGSSATPVSTLISDGTATILTTGTNQADDSGEAWTTTGLTTPVKQKLEVTFTPQMAGPVRWRVLVARPSTTVYIDPNVDLS